MAARLRTVALALTFGMIGTAIAAPALGAPERGPALFGDENEDVESAAEHSVTVDDLQHYGLHTGPLSSLSGTGVPGAEISVVIEYFSLADFEAGEVIEFEVVAPEATNVAEDGTWSLNLGTALDRVSLTLVAEQHVDGAWHSTAAMSLALLAPTTIDSIADGQIFDHLEAPWSASGSIDSLLGYLDATEADLEVTVEAVLTSDEGEAVIAVELAQGEWFAEFPEALEVGEYQLAVTHDFELAPGAEGGLVNALASPHVSFSVVEAEWTDTAPVTLDHFRSSTLYTGPVSALSGTGEPGAEVEIEAFIYPLIPDDVMADYRHYGPVQVASDGTWTIELSPVIERGSVDLAVWQFAGDDVTEAYVSYVEVFEATTITSIAEGDDFATSPAVVRGTLDPELEGYIGFWDEGLLPIAIATEVVLSDGAADRDLDVTIDSSGTWTADLDGPLPEGDYSLSIGHEIVELDEDWPGPITLLSTESEIEMRGAVRRQSAATPSTVVQSAVLAPAAVEQPGANELTGASVTFTVAAAEPAPPAGGEEPPAEDGAGPAPGPGRGTLPDTGIEPAVGGLGLTALLMVLTGLAVVVAARPRSSAS